MKLEHLVGQQLMIGIPGTKITPEILETFRETNAGGVIFFGPNFTSARQFCSLISNLENALGRRLITAVDHEGGRVIHLREGVTVFPDNLALGQTQNEDYAAWQGEIEARELRRLGIDLNLAPTLDVLTQNFSPNIGIRSYGRDPQLAGRLGAARIRMMQALGLSACAKHFPGQGQSPADAHLGLPVLPTTPQEMKKIHLKPFIAAIEAGVHTVMTSHPVYPKLDSKKQPATFSRRIVHGLLRKKLGFEGLILSDDLEMGALKGICDIGESAVRAIEAGHDIVLVCHDRPSQLQVSKALRKAYKSGRLSIKELEASIKRIQQFRQNRFFRFGEGKPFAEPRGAELAAKIAHEAVSVGHSESFICHPDPFVGHPERSEGSQGKLREGSLGKSRKISREILRCAQNDMHRKPQDGAKMAVIFPRLSALAPLIHIEKECLNEKAFVKKLFAEKGIIPSAIEIIGFAPLDSEKKAGETLAGKSDLVIFFCYDAHLFEGTRDLLCRVQKIARKCVVVLLRDPYDEVFVNKKNACIMAFGFRKVQIEAVVERMTC